MVYFFALFGMVAVVAADSKAMESPKESRSYVDWLKENSMLEQAKQIVANSREASMPWKLPYADLQSDQVVSKQSVWFTLYPASVIAKKGESVFEAIGNEKLWQVFSEIGINGIHVGPIERAGGVKGRKFTPSIDGYFDRIQFEIDPIFGSLEQFKTLVARADSKGGIVIGDIVPGHTGMGFDFILAKMNVEEYPGIYHMVSIPRKDWHLLPNVKAGKNCANLSASSVDALQKKGLIVGSLPRTFFYQPKVKETDWSATDIVEGIDKIERRWVYLHIFKDGQPTLNWIDPSFGAQRIIAGDIIHNLIDLKVHGLRLDANGFLGIETGGTGKKARSQGHPLAIAVNEQLGMLIRKFGGFSFQELNLSMEDLKAFSSDGADFSYDFVTRPACEYALVAKNADFLRLMFSLLRSYQISSKKMIHALQNHDELTLELVHFSMNHKEDEFKLGDESLKGSQIKEKISQKMAQTLTQGGYNLGGAEGVSCTMASLCAAALGIGNLDSLSQEDVRRIQQAHLVLAAFNALQPGIFALSGWDLVGALTISASEIKEHVADGDTRWINRGGYDLMGNNPGVQTSVFGLPKARSLYGSLPSQMKQSDSFVKQLQEILVIRESLRIQESEIIASPDVDHPQVFVMIHQLPKDAGHVAIALNFSDSSVEENLRLQSIPEVSGRTIVNLNSQKSIGSVDQNGSFSIELKPFAWQVLHIRK